MKPWEVGFFIALIVTSACRDEPWWGRLLSILFYTAAYFFAKWLLE
jgi:hypothetical protein